MYDTMLLQQVDEKLESRGNETPATDDTVLSWPQTVFNLPDVNGVNHR